METTDKIGVVVVTGSCCMPGAAPLDAAARSAVVMASSKTGADVEIREVSATAAAAGALPQHLLADVLEFQKGNTLPLPVVLIAGKVVDVGTIDPEKIVLALRAHQESIKKS